MRLSSLVGTICASCLVTGLIVYGAIFVLPKVADSATELHIKGINVPPKFDFSIGSAEGLVRPNAVAVDKQGRIYVTDVATAKVHVFTKKGKKISTFGKKGLGNNEFVFPNGILVDKNDDLIISDSVKCDIKLFSRDGKYLKTIFKSAKVKPGSMAFDAKGLIYVSDLLGNKIIVIDENGKIKKEVFDKNSPIKYPQAIAIDKKGKIWVADAGDFAIKVFNEQGLVEKVIKGGESPSSKFSLVRGIAIDSIGRVLVTDTLNHKIIGFDSNGQPDQNTYLSSTKINSWLKDLIYPTNIMIDHKGDYLIVDRGTASVKVFSTD